MTENTENPTWGEAPPPQAEAPGPRWSGRKTIAAVAIAVGIAAVGGGVIYAAGNSDAAQQGMGGPGRGGYGRDGMGFPGAVGSPFGDTKHGEFQVGEVTEVSSSSITVKSTDGYSKTYTIDADTKVNQGQSELSTIAKGDTVTLIATDATADAITEGTAGGRGQFPGGNGQRGQGQNGQQGQLPPGNGQNGQQPPGGNGQPPTT
ncbi:hypothetical protein [Actinosynnema sp. NPDC020468]|uniref:hypothetical protein n=1 Tax=Actinosynnema sp. NPDC020468 TaxID=3154488 RepID=UPI0034088C38